MLTFGRPARAIGNNFIHDSTHGLDPISASTLVRINGYACVRWDNSSVVTGKGSVSDSQVVNWADRTPSNDIYKVVDSSERTINAIRVNSVDSDSYLGSHYIEIDIDVGDLDVVLGNYIRLGTVASAVTVTHSDTTETEIGNKDVRVKVLSSSVATLGFQAATSKTPVSVTLAGGTKWWYRTHPVMPYEHQVTITNSLKADLWICIPFIASDDYVRQLSLFLMDGLHSKAKVYLEYSNEVWNSERTFQYNHALGKGSQVDAQIWTATRSGEIFDIFEEQWPLERLIRVFPGQSASTGVINNIFSNISHEKGDAIAIAPYFAEVVITSADDDIVDLLKRVEKTITDDAKVAMTNHYSVAKSKRLALISYGGGQHFTTDGSVDALDFLTQANEREEMELNCYDPYLDMVKGNLLATDKIPVPVFVHYAHQGNPSNLGYWGVLRASPDSITDRPKYRSIRKRLWPQEVY